MFFTSILNSTKTNSCTLRSLPGFSRINVVFKRRLGSCLLFNHLNNHLSISKNRRFDDKKFGLCNTSYVQNFTHEIFKYVLGLFGRENLFHLALERKIKSIKKPVPVIPLFGSPIFPTMYSWVPITHEPLANYLKERFYQKKKTVGCFLTKKTSLELCDGSNLEFGNIQKEKVVKKINLKNLTTKNEQFLYTCFQRPVNLNNEVDRYKTNYKFGDKYNMGLIKELSQIHQVGTLSTIGQYKKVKINDRYEHFFMLRGSQKIMANSCQWNKDHLTAEVEKYKTDKGDLSNELIRGYTLNIIDTINQFLAHNPTAREMLQYMLPSGKFQTPHRICDLIATIMNARREEMQEILIEQNILPRLEKCLTYGISVLKEDQIKSEIDNLLEVKIEELQKKYRLEQQLIVMGEELGMKSDSTSVVKMKFEKLLNERKNDFPNYVTEAIQDQLERLDHLDSGSNEYNVIRSYLDWITYLPWNRYRKENLDIPYARKILEEDHFGLSDIKQSILEFIAVGNLKKKLSGKILCLVGPPGTGKTSIGKSIARALNREYFRYSVGGLTDVHQLKGFKRTYIGALPGIFIQAFKKLKTSNPVFVIDEVDKIGRSFRGDPVSSLLDALDQEQNSEFMDHYLDLPFDLSKVLFVTTANSTKTIPLPLLDRMEILRISGYTKEEKIQIAKHYLIPSAIVECGLDEDQVEITDKALNILIEGYCREEGVRNLKNHLEKIFRKLALQMVENSVPDPQKAGNEIINNNDNVKGNGNSSSNDNQGKKASNDLKKIIIDPVNLSSFIGKPIFLEERIFKKSTVGIVTGLSTSVYGGFLLFIESVNSENEDSFEIIEPISDHDVQNNNNNNNNNNNKKKKKKKKKKKERNKNNIKSEYEENIEVELNIKQKITNEKSSLRQQNLKKKSQKQGHLKITGKLGSVMKESSQIAYSFAKTFLRKLQPNNDYLEVTKIHTHSPEGGIKKDGPSAGVTIATSLLSLALNKPIKENLAMSGEITLTGKILSIGGVKEKILAAKRSGITQIIFPKDNQRDWDELDNYIKSGLKAYFVSNYHQLYKIAFPIDK